MNQKTKTKNPDIFIRFGRWLNEWLKSYGTSNLRRYAVRKISSIIAQIEFSEYKKIRCTPVWRDCEDVFDEFRK